MSDSLDRRIQSFVVQLLEDPPPPPPFPQPGMVVVRSDDPRGREHMLDTKNRQDSTTGRPRRSGPLKAGLAFVAVLAIVLAIGAIVVLTDDADAPPAAPSTTAAPTTTVPAGPPAEGAMALVGETVDATGAGSRPDRITFREDGTYEVVDSSTVTNTGTYVIEGDEIVFVTDPTETLRWIRDDINFLQEGRESCEGVEGRYRVEFASATEATLRVVSDACRLRIVAANNLTLTLQTP